MVTAAIVPSVPRGKDALGTMMFIERERQAGPRRGKDSERVKEPWEIGGRVTSMSEQQMITRQQLRKIEDVAADLGLEPHDWEPYGRYKAKIGLHVHERLKDRKQGRLIYTTAITATPGGEGKTTIAIGLTQSLELLGKRVCLALRKPSLGPHSASRVERPVEARLKSHRPTRSTCTSQVIFTPSELRTTCWLRLSTIICSTAISLALTPARSHGAV